MLDARAGAACDFRLVSTYVPLLATIVRAQVLIFAAFAVEPLVPAHVYAAMLLFAVYFDTLVHAGALSSAVGGHLLPVCFVWMVRPLGAPVAVTRDALLSVNVLWYAVVHALVASYTFRRKVPVGAVPILVANAALAVGCVWLSTARVSMLEMHARSVCYYVFVYVHFYVFQTRSQWDAGTHACLGPHLGLHLLLADARFAAVSACCLVFMCVRVYLQRQDHHDSEPALSAAECGENARAGIDGSIEDAAMAELLQELLAAKAVAQEG